MKPEKFLKQINGAQSFVKVKKLWYRYTTVFGDSGRNHYYMFVMSHSLFTRISFRLILCADM